MRRVAAIDCGTNSLRLLVADVDRATRHSRQLDRRTTIVRLGQDVDRTGSFSAVALERTYRAVEDYARIIESFDVDAVRFVATSAARDVPDRREFVEGVLSRLGVSPEVISADEEAQLSYRGATAQLMELDWVPRPIVVLDIGGGSTELVTRRGESGPVVGQSLKIGSVRMAERYFDNDPPTRPQIEALVADVEAALDTLQLDLHDIGTLVGVAGTVTTMTAMVLDLPGADHARVDQARLPVPQLLAAVDTIVAMTIEERRALPFMHPGRADVIGAGALVLGCVVRRVRPRELMASEHDILDAVAWSLA